MTEAMSAVVTALIMAIASVICQILITKKLKKSVGGEILRRSFYSGRNLCQKAV